MSKLTPELVSEKNADEMHRLIFQFDETFQNLNPGKRLVWTTKCFLWCLSYLEMHSRNGRPFSQSDFDYITRSIQDCIRTDVDDKWVVMEERVHFVKLESVPDELRAISDQRHSKYNEEQ